jgi:DNA-binding NtrC family response regulator
MKCTNRRSQVLRKGHAFPSLVTAVPENCRALIVCDDDFVAERLKNVSSAAGVMVEWAKSMAEGCEAARSGRFHVIFTSPVLSDGSWTRLVDIATRYDLAFEVVLVASTSTFESTKYGEMSEKLAFDILDPLRDLPINAETTRRAVWAGYLMGAGRCVAAG